MAQLRKGIFVTVEGGEGVGKSLFLNKLCSHLTGQSLTVCATREPGGTPTAERLRQVFSVPPESDPLTPEAELFIISAARAQHVYHKIAPALKAGEWVLCDRFADSTLVYQGILGGVSRPLIEAVTQAASYGLSPDLTFLLDCDVHVSLARIKARQDESPHGGGVSRYDAAELSFHQNLRQAYLDLADAHPQRIVTLDAAKAPDAVADEAFEILKERFTIESKTGEKN